MNIREFVIDSLKGFYQRLPLKKINVDGVEVVPDSSGVAYIETNAAQNLDLAYAYTASAYNYIMGQMIDNELIVAYALTDIDDRLNNLDIDVDLSAYATKSEIAAKNYAGYSYVYNAYAYVLNTIIDNEFVVARALENCVSYDYLDTAAYVKKSELVAQSYAGYSYVYNAYAYLSDKLYDITNKTAYSYNFVTNINLVEEITNTSTYSQYASAKATYNFIDDEHLLISAAAAELNSRINLVGSNIITTEAQTYLNSLGEATTYITNAYSYIASFDYLYAAALTNLESRIAQLETYHNN